MIKKIFYTIMLSASCFLFGFTPVTVCASETQLSEHGDDEAFLSDKERQNEWEKQVWDIADKEPVRGDWKSKTRSTGSWTWRDGVICVTDSYASVPFFNNGHAGLVAVAPYYDATVEANPGDGVQPKYGAWNVRFPTGRVVQVGVNSTTEAQDQQAAAWACSQIGKPYSLGLNMYGTRDRYYCSQLVWVAYYEATGVDLDTVAWPGYIHPYELVNTSKTSIIYER